MARPGAQSRHGDNDPDAELLRSVFVVRASFLPGLYCRRSMTSNQEESRLCAENFGFAPLLGGRGDRRSNPDERRGIAKIRDRGAGDGRPN
jgi:hypothetical protein